MFNGYRRTTRDYRTITDHIHQRICKKNTRIILMFLFFKYTQKCLFQLYIKLHTHTKTALLDLNWNYFCYSNLVYKLLCNPDVLSAIFRYPIFVTLNMNYLIKGKHSRVPMIHTTYSYTPVLSFDMEASLLYTMGHINNRG